MKQVFSAFFLLFAFSSLYAIGSPRIRVDSDNKEVKRFTDNLFNKIMSDQSIVKVDKFSAEIAGADFLSFDILDRTENQVKFGIELGKTHIRGVKYSTSAKAFTMSKNGDIYSIANDQSDLVVEYASNTKTYTVIDAEDSKLLAEVDLSKLSDEKYSEVLIDVIVLREFSDASIERSSNSISIVEAEAGRKWEGMGIGFWTNSTDAHHFCEKDKNSILQAHPGWWTPGVSYSCVWGEHLCTCTANFYSGS